MGKLQREWKGNAIKLQSIFLSPYPIFKGISNKLGGRFLFVRITRTVGGSDEE